jgi:membrane-associated phospholipid phosphatase
MTQKAFLLFFFLFCIISLNDGQNIDINLLRKINVNRSTNLDGSFNLISNSTYPIGIAAPLGLFVVGHLKHNEKMVNNGIISGSAVVLTVAISAALKYSIRRNRPYDTYPDIRPYSADNSPSFPSNHSSVAFCTATSLSLAYPKWYIIVPSYTWASAVAYSRLHLGEHYPSDVVAGAFVGAASAVVSYKLNKWILRQYYGVFPKAQRAEK